MENVKIDWVSDDTKVSNGLDLLGLRLPNLAIGNQLLSGITTITPTVRYFSLRVWIIKFYNDQILNKFNISISDFAAKIESAIVISNLRKKPGMAGLIGYIKGTEIVNNNQDNYPLQRLTSNIAFSIYSNPSFQLGLSDSIGNKVFNLSEERGLNLAECIGSDMNNSKLFSLFKYNPDLEIIDKETAEEISVLFDMEEFYDDEKNILIDTIMPPNPGIYKNRINEISRVVSYTVLLKLAKELNRIPNEQDFFNFIRETNSYINDTTQKTINGWLVYHVRDMITAVHEAVLYEFIEKLRIRQEQNESTHISQIINDLLNATDDFKEVFQEIGFKFDHDIFDITITELSTEIKKLLKIENESEGLSRWYSQNLNENIIIDNVINYDNVSIILLPISWLMARHRISEESKYAQDASIHGYARIGLLDVIIPKLKQWEKTNEKLSSILPEMIYRTVDQHLRITWARLANDPRRDVSLLWNDESYFRYQNDFNPGRADSRLNQAVKWLEQLGLINTNGLSTHGNAILDRNLSILSNLGEK